MSEISTKNNNFLNIRYVRVCARARARACALMCMCVCLAKLLIPKSITGYSMSLAKLLIPKSNKARIPYLHTLVENTSSDIVKMRLIDPIFFFAGTDGIRAARGVN